MEEVAQPQFAPSPVFVSPDVLEYEPPFVPSDVIVRLQARSSRVIQEQLTVRQGVAFLHDFQRQASQAVLELEATLLARGGFDSEVDTFRNQLIGRKQCAVDLLSKLTDSDGFPLQNLTFHPDFYAALASISPESLAPLPDSNECQLQRLARLPPPSAGSPAAFSLVSRFRLHPPMKVTCMCRDIASLRCIYVGDAKGRVARVDLVDQKVCWGPVTIADFGVVSLLSVAPSQTPRGVVSEAAAMLHRSGLGGPAAAVASHTLRGSHEGVHSRPRSTMRRSGSVAASEGGLSAVGAAWSAARSFRRTSVGRRRRRSESATRSGDEGGAARVRVVTEHCLRLQLPSPRGVLVVSCGDKMTRTYSFAHGATVAVTAAKGVASAVSPLPSAGGDASVRAMKEKPLPQSAKGGLGRDASSPPRSLAGRGSVTDAHSAAPRRHSAAPRRESLSTGAARRAEGLDADDGGDPSAAERAGDMNRREELRSVDPLGLGVPKLLQKCMGEDGDGWVWAHGATSIESKASPEFLEGVAAVTVDRKDGGGTRSPTSAAALTLDAAAALPSRVSGEQASVAASTSVKKGRTKQQVDDLASRLRGLTLAPTSGVRRVEVPQWKVQLGMSCVQYLSAPAMRWCVLGAMDGSVVFLDFVKGRPTGLLLPKPVVVKGSQFRRHKRAIQARRSRQTAPAVASAAPVHRPVTGRDDPHRGHYESPDFRYRGDAFDLRPQVPGGAAGSGVSSLTTTCAPRPGSEYPARALVDRPMDEGDRAKDPTPTLFEDLYNPTEVITAIGRTDGALLVAFSAAHCEPLRPPVPDDVQVRLEERTRGALGGHPPGPRGHMASSRGDFAAFQDESNVAAHAADKCEGGGGIAPDPYRRGGGAVPSVAARSSVPSLQVPHPASSVLLLAAGPEGKAHRGSVTALTVVLSGGWLLSGGSDGIVRQWDLGVIAAALRESVRLRTRSVIEPSGSSTALGGGGEASPRDEKGLVDFMCPMAVDEVSAASEGGYGTRSTRSAVAGLLGSAASRWESGSGVSGGTGGAVGGLGPAGSVCRAVPGALLQTFSHHHRDNITGIAVHAPSLLMVTSSLDTDVCVWSLRGSSSPLQVIRAHYHRVVGALTLQAPAICFAEAEDRSLHAGLLELARVGSAAGEEAAVRVMAAAAAAGATRPAEGPSGGETKAEKRKKQRTRGRWGGGVVMRGRAPTDWSECAMVARAQDLLGGGLPSVHWSDGGVYFDSEGYNADIRAWAVWRLRARFGASSELPGGDGATVEGPPSASWWESRSFTQLPARVRALLLQGVSGAEAALEAASAPLVGGERRPLLPAGSSVALSLRPAVRGLPVSDAATLIVGHDRSRVMRMLYGGEGAAPLRSARGVAAASDSVDAGDYAGDRSAAPPTGAELPSPGATAPPNDSVGLQSIESVLKDGTRDFAKAGGGVFGRRRSVAGETSPGVISDSPSMLHPLNSAASARATRLDAELYPSPVAAIDGLMDPDGPAFVTVSMDGDVCVYGVRVEDVAV